MAELRRLTDPRPGAEMTATVRDRLAQQRIYLIATPTEAARTPTTPDGVAWLGQIEKVIRSGVLLIQLRQKDGNTESRRAWLNALRPLLSPEGLLIVNDDLDALRDKSGQPLADGVHIGRKDARALGEGDLLRGLQNVRQELGSEALLGSSTRTVEEVRTAVEGGVDHVGFGAIARSPTKAGAIRADLAEFVRCTQAFPALPIFPIGGLNTDNLHLISNVLTRRAAMGSALLDAGDPEAAAQAAITWSRGG
jgi:thiamine-phosphate pyrophosphorylase